MSKLFIIGNGFDIAHGLPTSYDDFRKYLSNTYMNNKCEVDAMPMIPTVSIGSKGEEICDMEEVANFLVYIISEAEPDGNKWGDLEASLGRLDYDEAFEMLPEELDDDGDINYWRESYNNEDMASNLYSVVVYVKELFAEWVENIDIKVASAKSSFSTLLKSDDIFLTFNYTETLEDLYEVNEESVCHIHGRQGENILFGHGDANDYTDEYMRKNIGSENSLTELNNFLKKDTEKALEDNKQFFDGINNTIREVYSIGFSFACVDLIYIREICEKLPDNAVWYLNNFNPNDIPIFQKKLKECGFKGSFSTFII